MANRSSSPCADKSDSTSNDVADQKLSEAAQILRGFQASCDETASRLMSLAQKPKAKAKAGPQAPPSTNLVKPYLEAALDIVQFASNKFADSRLNHIKELSNVYKLNKENLAASLCKLEKIEPLVDKDLEKLQEYIYQWTDFEKYLARIYEMSINNQCPKPNLQAIKHPSPEVCQKAYSDLFRVAKTLCTEVGKGLQDNQSMYNQMKEEMDGLKEDMQSIFNKLTLMEGKSKVLKCKARDWIERFREEERNILVFLEEWEKGGDTLNQPPAVIPPPPKIIAIDTDFDPVDVSPFSESADDQPTKPEDLEAIIKRFTRLNSTLTEEVEKDVAQQEALNESMRAMNGTTKVGDTSAKEVSR